jgi:hypothetical protein
MKKVYPVILWLLLAQISSGQVKDSTYKYWMNVGFAINSSSMANIGGSFNGRFQNLGFQVGYQLISRNLGLPYQELFFKELPLKGINVGIGQSIVMPFAMLACFVGPAYVWGEELDDNRTDVYGGHKTRQFRTVGIVFNSQIFFRPLPEIGIGFELYGNVNPIRSMAEARLSIQLSNLER